MLFSEEDAPLLKAWIVKRIENTSDADSDVLAEYVIALLKHDGDIASVRKLCEQEIPDFLTEDPKPFLDDVFQAIKHKLYIPGNSLPPAKTVPDGPRPAPNPQANEFDPLAPTAPRAPNRKRGYQDLDDPNYQEAQFPAYGGRATKQARRSGGGRRGRGGDVRGGRQRGPQFMDGAPGFPPFDLNNSNPMDYLMQMQAMGMPFSPLGKNMGPGGPAAMGQPQRRSRCRDFDTKGFCARGSTCPYDHGNESSYDPPMATVDEYDPNQAMIPGGVPLDPTQYMQAFNAFLSGPPARGRGRGGRKDRGGRQKGSRAGFSGEGPGRDRSKTTIVVVNIPEESLGEDHVRTFFSQFGSISEVSMQPLKQRAVVKFDDPTAADAAYHSPKAIFDNRFVRVFRQTESSSNNGGANSNGGAEAHLEQGHEAEPEPELDMEEFTKKQEEAQRKHEDNEAKRREIERQKQEVVRKQEELLVRYREETQKLQAKLAEKNGGDPGAASSNTEMLRAKVAALEQEAMLLGIDTSIPEDPNGYAPAFRGGYRGRGGFRGRGYAPRGRGGFGHDQGSRHAAYAQYSLDNRPKSLVIKGADFTDPEKDELLRHYLLNLGEFESVDSSPFATYVSFQDRKTAERFYHSLHEKELPGVEGKLQLEWSKTVGASKKPSDLQGSAASSSAGPQQSTSGHDHGVAAAVPDADDQAPSEDGEVPDDDHDQDYSRHDHQGGRQVDMDYDMGDQDEWGE